MALIFTVLFIPGSQNSTIPITSAVEGQVFLAPIAFADEPFLVVIDTGSSDTWVVRQRFACISITTGLREGQDQCAFGPQYVASSSFTEIPDQNFNVSYGDGEVLIGIVGYEEVCLGNVTVPSQEVGLVDIAAWNGDGKSSGILGLAYPSLTSAYAGDEQDSEQDSVEEEYEPIFIRMITHGLIEQQIFTLAISRDESSGGILTLGGLPDPRDVVYGDDFATVPIEVLGSPQMNGSSRFDPDYTFYTISIDGFPNPNASSSFAPSPQESPHSRWPNVTNIQAVIDSGTTLIYLPYPVTKAINSLFGSQANYDPTVDTWFVDCNATAPSWSLTIGGQNFNINPLDMIIQGLDGSCVSGVQDAFNGFSILGDVFLKTVLAVFDLGNAEMRFATRQ
ncbi:acid protease [Viridothelium virens]|uniref:Acid protease n=1 Tax=Viridothelium virens TaxID=1048519 RepID=A0A6A6HQE0_VIRVR|nr:acid protease [Viridothelium virens]